MQAQRPRAKTTLEIRDLELHPLTSVVVVSEVSVVSIGSQVKSSGQMSKR